MASNNQAIPHFADPHHLLGQTQYSPDEAGRCNICLLKLAGLSSVTYGCYTCNIHLHSACARYFPKTLSFFAHPAHTLKLRRSPGRICDICRGDCPEKSFVYSCIGGCGFDVHPLCSMFPERVGSPLDPSHQLCMFFSSESPAGSCSACHHPLPRWHYIGGSSLKLHIACAGQGSNNNNGHAAAVPAVYGAAAVVQQGSQRSLFGAPAAGPPAAGYYNHPVIIHGYGGHAGQAAGSYYYAAPPIHGVYYGTGQQSSFHNPSSLMSVIARFLLGTAISSVASDLISELLTASFN